MLGLETSQAWLAHHFPERQILDAVVRRGVDRLDHNDSIVGPASMTADATEQAPGPEEPTWRSLVRSIDLGRVVPNATGYAVVYRVRGWRSIRYVAVGVEGADGTFRHVKVRHPRQGHWDSVAVDVTDLVHGLENGWDTLHTGAVQSVQIRVSGSDDDGLGTADVAWAATWRADPELRLSATAEHRSVTRAVVSALADYVAQTQLASRAEAFLRDRRLSLAGPETHVWHAGSAKPVGPGDDPTSRFLWHGLVPASGLLAHGLATGSADARAAGHELVRAWLAESYQTVDDDPRYAWYDHAAAERMVAFVLARDDAAEHGGAAYAATLDDAVRRHALLLESEAFYVRNQNYRYHNHAMFQDLALLAAGLVTDLAGADRLVRRALSRLADQVDHLIVHEGDHAVLVENSIGYHHAMERLLACASTLSRLAGEDRRASGTVAAMRRFSRAFQYADGRHPAVGDTWRDPADATAERPRDDDLGVVTLPRAGYVAAHSADGTSMFVVATSLSATHKHCDNLSMTLFSQGVEWFVDPSFFSHAYDEPVPSYLRGPFAHTAVVVPGADYSIEPGTARIEASGDEYDMVIRGSHTAFAGYRVDRQITGGLQPLDLTVRDHVHSLDANDPAQPVAVLHLAEGVSARLAQADGRSAVLTHPDAVNGLLLTWDHATARVVSGWHANRPETSSVAGSTFGVMADTTSILLAMPSDGAGTWRVRTAPAP
ncbi:heparinase II/III family protein [Cellulomonas sp. HZM]|uniref:heparinase II/III domain-containing protein n=1 Tax=Cellulomonas sp. HZM TaxID=1454010 RepID=UPI0012DD4840|nr:heparinase II/III family protein [Cellulomonas sp. HZM]